jgi:hypothetical protein
MGRTRDSGAATAAGTEGKKERKRVIETTNEEVNRADKSALVETVAGSRAMKKIRLCRQCRLLCRDLFPSLSRAAIAFVYRSNRTLLRNGDTIVIQRFIRSASFVDRTAIVLDNRESRGIRDDSRERNPAWRFARLSSHEAVGHRGNEKFQTRLATRGFPVAYPARPRNSRTTTSGQKFVVVAASIQSERLK